MTEWPDDYTEHEVILKDPKRITLVEVGWVYRAMSIDRERSIMKIKLIGDLKSHPMATTLD